MKPFESIHELPNILVGVGSHHSISMHFIIAPLTHVHNSVDFFLVNLEVLELGFVFFWDFLVGVFREA